jgi:hypothetical protein
LVGRGVLLDFKAYADAHDIKYSCFEARKITIAELEATAKWEGVTFKQGDVLIVRSGYTEDLGKANAEEQVQMMSTHQMVGVEGTEESAKWFWNHHFSAVAGDAIGFEVIPPAKDGVDGAGTVSELGE